MEDNDEVVLETSRKFRGKGVLWAEYLDPVKGDHERLVGIDSR